LALVLAAALVLSACVTGPSTTLYKPAQGGGYGYGGQQIGDTRFRVTFSGNSRTPRETVETYLLYRAAEITLQRGYDAFVVTDKDTERFSRYTTTGPNTRFGYDYRWGHPPYGYRYGPDFSPGWRQDFYGPMRTRADHRYTASATILMRRGLGAWDDPAIYDARDVVRHLKPGVAYPVDDTPLGVVPSGVAPAPADWRNWGAGEGASKS